MLQIDYTKAFDLENQQYLINSMGKQGVSKIDIEIITISEMYVQEAKIESKNRYHGTTFQY